MNLHDYAEDPQLKEAAGLVLDRQIAKFLVGSSEGRRFVPFRRQMPRVAKVDKQNGPGAVTLEESDFTATLALLYVGHTEQLPDQSAHRSAAQELMYPAVSKYRPSYLLTDLGLQSADGKRPDGTDGIWQHWVHHDGYELYAKGRHFSVLAGGDETGFANTFELLGIPTTALKPDDRGAALPTTLMINGGWFPRDRLWQFLRIHGDRSDYPDGVYTYKENLCVWKGFACGKDMRVPPDMYACFVDGPTTASGKWRFFSSSHCAAYQGTEPVFVAIFSSAIGAVVDNDTARLGDGFFEAVDAEDAGHSFDAFRSATISNNNTLVSPYVATYRSARGEAIAFRVPAVTSVDGANQSKPSGWNKGIYGNILNTRQKAYLEIHNPRFNKKLLLDFTREDNPTRRVQ